MEIKATTVKELRERSGAGIMDCKEALRESGGDLEKASDLLRKKGLAAAGRRSGRATREGSVGAYVHAGGRLGVLIELNCETDFVARTDQFQQLVKDLAMHVAAASPEWVRRDQVPAAALERERGILLDQVRNSGKPEKIWDKIVTGRLEKFYAERCLEEQPFIRDPEQTVLERVQGVVSQTGENMRINRFARFVLGDGDPAPSDESGEDGVAG